MASNHVIVQSFLQAREYIVGHKKATSFASKVSESLSAHHPSVNLMMCATLFGDLLECLGDYSAASFASVLTKDDANQSTYSLYLALGKRWKERRKERKKESTERYRMLLSGITSHGHIDVLGNCARLRFVKGNLLDR